MHKGKHTPTQGSVASNFFSYSSGHPIDPNQHTPKHGGRKSAYKSSDVQARNFADSRERCVNARHLLGRLIAHPPNRTLSTSSTSHPLPTPSPQPPPPSP